MTKPAKAKARSDNTAKYERRRMEVLQAAARTFNRLGFHIATLDDVASELGVTKPAIYYYAKSKDELLADCGTLALDAFDTALDKTVTPEHTGLERLATFFRFYTEIICQDFGRCLVLTEPRDLAPESRKINLAGRRDLNLAIRTIVAEGIRDGSIRPCNERAVANALFDAFNGIGRWFNPKGPATLDETIDQYLEIFLSGIAASDPPPTKSPSPQNARG